jgi:hypothetical protein
MAASTLALVHSPFVGPSAWTSVSRLFNKAGSNVVVPALTFEPRHGRSHYRALAQCVACATDPAGAIVLVVHSGAGSLADAIAEALGGRVAATVFVDAVLPHPQRSWMSTLPGPTQSQLRLLARGGHLPPWNEWFPPAVLERLIADEAARADFVAALPRVPLALADEMAPVQCRGEPRGYLRLSEGYDVEARAAKAAGWPVQSEALHHLAMVTHPDRVVTALRSLLDRLGPAI